MANLSNINNKFLVTTGGEVLVGRTAATGTSKLQVSGSLLIGTDISSGIPLVVQETTANGFAIGFMRNTNTTNGNGLVIDVNSTGGAYIQDWRQASTVKMRLLQNGNLGIGTDSPTESKLVISGGATGTVGGGDAGITMINKFDNPDNSWSILPVITGVSNTGFSIRDNTDSADRLVIDGSGKVGIGTNSPGVLLQVGDTPTSSSQQGARIYGYDGALNLYTKRAENPFNAALYLYNNPVGEPGLGTGILFRARTSTTDGQVQATVYSNWTTSTHATRTAKLVFQTCNTGTVSDKMTILGNGNVGIGVPNPGARLELDNPSAFTNMIEYGNVAWNQNTGHGLVAVNRGSDGYVQLQITSGVDNADVFTIRNSGTGANIQHNFLSNGNVYHAGNVGIRVTSPTLGQLQVAGTGYFGPVGTGNATTKAEMQSNAVLRLKPHDNNSTNMNFAQVNNGGGIGIQTTNGPGTANWDIALSPFGGNVGIGNTSPRDKLTIFTPGSAEEEIALRLVNPIGFTNSGSGASIIFAQDRNTGENLPMAKIRSSQNAGGSSCCGDLIFSTSHTGLGGMIDRMKITASGDVEMTAGGSFSIGGTTTSEAKTQTEHTGSVDSSGKIILSSISDGMSSAAAAKVTVYGDNNSNAGFYDEVLVMANNSASPQVLVARNTNNAATAPTRTYSVVNNQLKLVMGSGSFNVNVKSEAMGFPY